MRLSTIRISNLKRAVKVGFDLKCKCGCGLDVHPSIQQFTDWMIAEFPVHAYKACFPTSGARCLKRNKEVKGSPNSSHIKGLAVDFSCTDSNVAYWLMFLACQYGIKRIVKEPSCFHFDIDQDKPMNILSWWQK